MTIIKEDLSDFKKELLLANHISRQYFYHEKAVWRILLKQYLAENKKYPLKYDANGIATQRSIDSFVVQMLKFSDRIVPTNEYLKSDNKEQFINLTFKTGLMQMFLFLRKK